MKKLILLLTLLIASPCFAKDFVLEEKPAIPATKKPKEFHRMYFIGPKQTILSKSDFDALTKMTVPSGKEYSVELRMIISELGDSDGVLPDDLILP